MTDDTSWRYYDTHILDTWSRVVQLIMYQGILSLELSVWRNHDNLAVLSLGLFIDLFLIWRQNFMILLIIFIAGSCSYNSGRFLQMSSK